MKTIARIIAVVMIFMAVTGCFMETLWVASTALSVKTAYNGYETLSSMKDVKDRSPAFHDYRKALVSVDVQPRKDNPEVVNRMVEKIYSRTLNDMVRQYGLSLQCEPYSRKGLDESDDALVIQVGEKKPSFWGKIMSGEKIHASIKYIDKKTAKVICEQNYKIARDYEAMIRLMTASALLRLGASENGRNPSWGATAEKIITQDKNYPNLTDEERAVLSRG
jgi:hypothetical protein